MIAFTNSTLGVALMTAATMSDDFDPLEGDSPETHGTIGPNGVHRTAYGEMAARYDANEDALIALIDAGSELDDEPSLDSCEPDDADADDAPDAAVAYPDIEVVVAETPVSTPGTKVGLRRTVIAEIGGLTHDGDEDASWKGNAKVRRQFLRHKRNPSVPANHRAA